MIKKSFHKIFSATLALLVLVSTVSFTIEKHFCGDVLVGISVFAQVEKCPMEAAELLQKKTCCKDEINVIQGQDELRFSDFEDVKLEQQQLLTAFVLSYINLFEGFSIQNILNEDYSPPNLVTNIQVLDQVFII